MTKHILEPQGFTLQISELSDERKKALNAEMKKRVYAGEKLGAREQETSEFEDEGFDKGFRENGVFLIPEEGLPDQTIDYTCIPVYCVHPHAWILYCCYRLMEN